MCREYCWRELRESICFSFSSSSCTFVLYRLRDSVADLKNKILFILQYQLTIFQHKALLCSLNPPIDNSSPSLAQIFHIFYNKKLQWTPLHPLTFMYTNSHKKRRLGILTFILSNVVTVLYIILTEFGPFDW